MSVSVIINEIIRIDISKNEQRKLFIEEKNGRGEVLALK